MTNMKDNDLLHRFLFENTDVRGNAVHLSDTIQQALQHTDYPPVLHKALSELMAAAALLTATVKLDQGTLSFQIQGQGPLNLLVVECNAALRMRATAKWQGDLHGLGFKDLIGNGHFAITLDPRDGGQTYQGIVEVIGDNIAQILETYMQQSAQLETRIWLSSNPHQAAGLLLQKLPQQQTEDQDSWQRTTMLADTVQADELLQLDTNTLLRRLFHEENVRLFDQVQSHLNAVVVIKASAICCVYLAARKSIASSKNKEASLSIVIFAMPLMYLTQLMQASFL